jgi:hypothetical protein
MCLLSKSLCWIARFLQSVDPYAKLRMHYDWRQHGVSGYPFVMEKDITYHEFFTKIGSPRDLLRVCSDDERVFVGVAPADDAWYLRFRCEWDEDGFNLNGTMDFTLPKSMAAPFQTEVLSYLQIKLQEQDEDSYFAEIGPQPGRGDWNWDTK